MLLPLAKDAWAGNRAQETEGVWGGRRAAGRAREKPAPALASATAGLVPSLPPRVLTVSPAAWDEPPPGLHGNCPRQATSATGPASHSQDVLGKSTFVFVTHEVTCSASTQGRSPESPRGLSQAAAGRAESGTHSLPKQAALCPAAGTSSGPGLVQSQAIRWARAWAPLRGIREPGTEWQLQLPAGAPSRGRQREESAAQAPNPGLKGRQLGLAEGWVGMQSPGPAETCSQEPQPVTSPGESLAQNSEALGGPASPGTHMRPEAPLPTEPSRSTRGGCQEGFTGITHAR